MCTANLNTLLYCAASDAAAAGDGHGGDPHLTKLYTQTKQNKKIIMIVWTGLSVLFFFLADLNEIPDRLS